MNKANKETKKLVNSLKRSIDSWSGDDRSMDRTIEVIPDDHIYQLSESELKELDRGFGREGEYFVTFSTEESVAWPPMVGYLSDVEREYVGMALGNWMAYTEDLVDELVEHGVKESDLESMIFWKRDTD